MPKGFLWRLTILNTFVIAAAIALSGWAIYNTACFLVEGIGNLNETRQKSFNVTLFQYLLIFTIIGISFGSLLHYYLTKRLIKPIKQLIESMKQLKTGEYPKPIKVTSQDEIGELVQHYNELIRQLSLNENQRNKLISDLSHEIRTPVANINGYLHALQAGVIKGDEKIFKALYEESKRLTQMIEQIDLIKEWDYISSQHMLKKEQVDITQLIRQSVSMFDWRLKEANIALHIALEDAQLMVHKEGIQQVLSNIINNAIRYYEGNGNISIRGESIGNKYVISVSGPSKKISPEDQDQLFERFYRTDQSRNRETGGSGLGLAIAKEIVQRHQGEIGLITEGRKNTFWVKLPHA